MQYERDDLEKIQTEAARNATGTTKLISLSEIAYSETGWDTLDIREKNKNLHSFTKWHITWLHIT